MDSKHSRHRNFNPRSHEGSDIDSYCVKRVITVDFNPRSHEGSDRTRRAVTRLMVDFNPRSHEGSDSAVLLLPVATSNFNPRSHEGSDSNFRQKVLFSLSKNCLKYLILTTNYFN